MQTQSSQHAAADPGVTPRQQLICRRGLTLVELLVTISIIAILASIFLGALQTATEEAKSMKTKSMIVKLNNLIMPRYEAYRTRRVPLNITAFTIGTAGTAATTVASATSQRLNGLYELMRFELPEAWTDITDNPMFVTRPALSQAYLGAYMQNGGTFPPPATGIVPQNQNAETLYMIVTLGFVDELGGRDLFNESNVGDTDGDGFPEFLDAWGTPIRFLRWAPGFTASELNGAGGQITNDFGGNVFQVKDSPSFGGLSRINGAYTGRQIIIHSGGVMEATTVFIYAYDIPTATATITLDPSVTLTNTPQTGDYFGIDPDPFNPLNLNMNQNPPMAQTTNVGFAIYPLIYSAGPDRVFSIVSESGLQNGNTTGGTSGTLPDATSWKTIDPYWSVANAVPPPNNYPNGPVGWTADLSGESATSGWYAGMNGWLDNIHNHLIGTR